MLKQLREISINNVDDIVKELRLNWKPGFPLWELFGKEIEDINLLFQLETALKQLCLLNHRLEKDPNLTKDTNFIKDLKRAMSSLLILLPQYDGIALIKDINGRHFHIELIACDHDSENIYPIRDFNLYFLD